MRSRTRGMLRPQSGDAPLLDPSQAIPQLFKALFFSLLKKPSLKFCPSHAEKGQGEANLPHAPSRALTSALHPPIDQQS